MTQDPSIAECILIIIVSLTILTLDILYFRAKRKKAKRHRDSYGGGYRSSMDRDLQHMQTRYKKGWVENGRNRVDRHTNKDVDRTVRAYAKKNHVSYGSAYSSAKRGYSDFEDDYEDGFDDGFDSDFGSLDD